MGLLPNLVIIGAQKSATTFVHHCLSEHPEIYMPSGETPFFESPDYEQSSISSLEKIFEGRKEKVRGIKRPTYLGKPEVPDRIREHLPNAKVIAVLRNPIERAMSAYFHNINYGFMPALEIAQGVRMLSDDEFRNQYKRAFEIIEFGYYYKYLTKYNYYLERGQLLVLLYDDIRDRPAETIRKIYQFLDVDISYLPRARSSRPQAVIYSLSRLRFLSLRNRFLFSYDDSGTRLHAKKRNPIGFITAVLITLIDKLLLRTILGNRKPVLTNDLSRHIFQLYKEDIRSLESLIGRSLKHWRPLETDCDVKKTIVSEQHPYEM